MSKLPFKINKGDTALEKIMAYHIDPVKFPLSDKLQEIKGRWSDVLQMRLNYYSPQQVVDRLIEKYGISQAQAYIDLRNSEILYGSLMDSDRKGKMAILYEYAHKFYQRAIQAKDLKAQAKALELMKDFGGVDDDVLEFNPEKFENFQIQVNLTKSLQEKLVEMLKTGTTNFNDLDVTDMDYEEVNNE